MTSIIASIQPEWCELIASGKKTVEVRKTAPKVPFKVYIYCTEAKPDLKKVCKQDMQYYFLNGKVIGEFVCDKVETYIADDFVGAVGFDGNIITKPIPGEFGYWIPNQDRTCLTYKEILEYGGGKNIYGWHISNLVIYDKPKELSEFIKPSKRGCCNIPLCGKGCPHFVRGCDAAGIEDDCYAEFDTDEFEPIFRPPQSWMYCTENAVNDFDYKGDIK